MVGSQSKLVGQTNYQQYKEAYRAKHGKYPGAKLQEIYWDGHPEEYKESHGESLAMAKARVTRGQK